MIKKISLIEFEKKIIKKMLGKHNSQNIAIEKQYLNAKIEQREFSGHGFFTHFFVPKGIPRVSSDMEIHTNGKVNSIDVGFILFVKKGTLDFLEGFTYGEQWPKDIFSFELTSDKPQIFEPIHK